MNICLPFSDTYGKQCFYISTVHINLRQDTSLYYGLNIINNWNLISELGNWTFDLFIFLQISKQLSEISALRYAHCTGATFLELVLCYDMEDLFFVVVHLFFVKILVTGSSIVGIYHIHSIFIASKIIG